MIDTKEALVALVEHLLTCDSVALDTEFVSEQTYYPALGLVQIGWGEGETELVDPVLLKDITPLGRVLQDPGIVKIFHDPQQDLPILRRATNTYPRNVFDTQRAAGLVGLRAQMSLGKLLQALLDVSIPKTETLSDWLVRPLTRKQTDYARNDVRFLLAARQELLSRARLQGRETWLQEEMARYDDKTLYDEETPDALCARLMKTGNTGRRPVAVMRELVTWREKEAQGLDVPRGYILSDKVLVNLARRQPESTYELSSMRNLKNSKIRRHASGILEAIARGMEATLNEPTRRSHEVRNTEAHKIQTDLALAYLKGKCLANGIDSRSLATRSDVSTFLSGEDGVLSHGWRYAFVGNDLQAILRGSYSIRVDPVTGLPFLV